MEEGEMQIFTNRHRIKTHSIRKIYTYRGTDKMNAPLSTRDKTDMGFDPIAA